MNKQELIEKLKKEQQSIKWGISDGYNAFYNGIDTAYSIAIGLAKKLDEPKKVVIPQFVADWFEDNFEELDWELGGVLINAFNTNRSERSDFQDWLVDTTNYPIETLIRMKLFGYEVEKEQLYYVKFDILYLQKYLVKNVETDQFYLSNNEKVVGNYEQVRFTEQEIKSIDERYWPFAEKV
ncbi:DUF1642 domain-containing protein, partial [Enterococcus faecalis]|uniref:DUF1642 domain-containing protein n=1 Tax=Enterococcus faecalis TaxID=1351 RepID=UPI00259AF2BE